MVIGASNAVGRRRSAAQSAEPLPPEPVSPADLEATIQRGVNWLLTHQRPDGAFGGPERTKDLNITASPPGAHHAFQMATTALVICALIEVGGDSPEAKKVIDKAEGYMFDACRSSSAPIRSNCTTSGGMATRSWLSCRMHGRYPNDTERKKKIEDLIRLEFEMLQHYESVDGGWGYYDMKIGAAQPEHRLDELRQRGRAGRPPRSEEIGVEPPEKLMKRAIVATQRQRKPDFSYLYGEYLKYEPMMPINRPGGSLGRSQACNLALRLWGDPKVTEQVSRIGSIG